MKRKTVGIELVALSLCLLLSGCISNGNSVSDTEYAQSISSNASNQAAAGASATESKPGEDSESENPAQSVRIQISDFYDYVNAEWIAQNSPCNEESILKSHSAEPKVDERVMMLLKDKETEDNFDLLFLQTWFEQWVQAGYDDTKEIAQIRELMDRVQAAKNSEELYELMKDDDLSLLNPYMEWNYVRMTDGSYCFDLNPSLDQQYAYWSPDQLENVTENLTTILCKLGYSENQAKRMTTNTLWVDKKLTAFWDTEDESVYISRDDQISDELLEHIFDIQQATGYTYTPQFKNEKCEDFIWSSYPDLLGELFSAENLEKAKDYYSVSIFIKLYPYTNKQLSWEFMSLKYDKETMGNAPWTREDYESIVKNSIVSKGYGILEHAYVSKYISAEIRKQWEESFEQVKEHMAAVIKESTWLDTRARGMLTVKVMKATLSLGEHLTYPSLSEFGLGDNAVDSYLLFLKAMKAYEKRYLEEGQDHTEIYMDLFQANATYDTENVVFVGNPLVLFASEGDHPNMELFRFEMLAHELAHALDPQRVTVLSDGSETNFFSDEQQTLYDAMMMKIAASVDGRKTQFGNTIHGEQVSIETFCDLFSIKAMLHYWKSKGETDIAPVFESFASHLAAVITNDYDSYVAENDSHMPSRERVNYILGHFDEFYETYAVDENGPCFVPQEDRISVFE